MTLDRPISEEDLQAYVDERLEPRRLAAVEAYLTAHPAEARRIAGYADERASLRAALAPYAEEPVPPELNLAALIEAHRRPRHLSWRTAAAAVLLVGLGGLGGWSLPHGASDRGIAALAEEAAESYAAYAPDQMRPVELRAADRSELVDWVSRRLDRPVAVPDLTASGYRFNGRPHGADAPWAGRDVHV